MRSYKAITTIVGLGAFVVVGGEASATIIHQNINAATPNGTPLNLDINSDGIDDLQFGYTYSSSHYRRNGDLWANGLNGSQVTFGGPLGLGNLIDTTNLFSTTNHLADHNYNHWHYYYSCGRRGRGTCMGTGSSHSETGTWNNGYNQVTGYLGFVLNVGAEELFGWANLTMNYNGFATIHDLAYEKHHGIGIAAGQTVSTHAKQASAVPEPSSLALLALGATGIAGIRRRRKQA
jgi:hypothetical protein